MNLGQFERLIEFEVFLDQYNSLRKSMKLCEAMSSYYQYKKETEAAKQYLQVELALLEKFISHHKLKQTKQSELDKHRL